MISSTFQIGQEVEVTGPDINGKMDWIGKRFVVERSRACEKYYTAFHVPLFPASSLRLVEELKIGDWVRGIYNGHTFQIDYIKPRMESKTLDYSGKDEPMYLAFSLRKLTPEEIEAHLHPIQVSATMDCSEFAEGMAKCQDKLWKIGIEARLSAIEKQLKEQHGKISQFDGEISHLLASIQECLMESGDVEARTRCREMAIEKRLDFIEKFQRDQTRDALCKGWMAGP